MSAYDFTAASDFLQYEAGVTPEDLYCEIVEAMAVVSKLESKRNRKAALSVWGTLLTCADFIERITPKEERRAVCG